jgi:hypothetical protein
MMANSARDPYWQAAVRREVLDHPKAQAAIEHECSACHMPMARYEAKAHGRASGAVFAHLPSAGYRTPRPAGRRRRVVLGVPPDQGPRSLAPATASPPGSSIDTTVRDRPTENFRPVRGDKGLTSVMRSATAFTPTEATHLQKSEMCATCHTLYTHALGADGKVIGELPEQVPYLEWLHSATARSRAASRATCRSSSSRCDLLHARRASPRLLQARVPRRQLLHAADAQPVRRRSRPLPRSRRNWRRRPPALRTIS